jgi:hypothetical protein
MISLLYPMLDNESPRLVIDQSASRGHQLMIGEFLAPEVSET